MAVRTFAAIDVGSFELELGIYEMTYKTGIRRIDHVRHVIALGKDTYSTGKISYELVEEMCQVLEEFVQIMKSYKVKDYRAYATSAMREAHNRQIILDQIRVRTGLTVRIISNSEQRFISYKAIAAKAAEFNKIIQKGTAIVDVGFGSAQLSLFDKDSLVTTQNLPLGTLRVRGLLARIPATVEEHKQHIEEIVDNELFTFRKMYLKDRQIKNLIATGESIIYMVKKGMKEANRDRFTAEQFKAFCKKLTSMSVDEIEDYYEIEHDYAALLIPGAIIYKKVLDMLGAESVWIPGIRLCDGIAAEYAEESRLIKFHHDFEGDILSSARNMAKRYKCYAAHTQEVERTAVALFNATRKYHGLSNREGLLLQIAAILHACGKFVSITKSTENAYQIIMATEIIGLSHLEREIVANVVRYNIQEFAYDGVILESDFSRHGGMNISRRELTILIAKLTAILRLANSMDRGHKQKLSDFKVAVREGSLVVTTGYTDSIVLERFSFEQKADFFEEIFGIRPVLRQKRGI